MADVDALVDMEVDFGRYPGALTPWARTPWREDVLGWVADRTAEVGSAPDGAMRVRVRPWSVVIRIPLHDGAPLWFKASPPAALFEAGLIDALARWAPDSVLAPIAVDRARGWALLRDGGELLRDRTPDVGEWERTLRDYARLQRELVPRVGDLLTLGVPDARTDSLRSVYTTTVDALLLDLDNRESAALADLAPRLGEAAADLAAVGIPDSLDHADVHDGQVLVGADGRPRVFDWGDASVAHPFASLRVPLERATEVLGSDAMPRLRDAYLEPWSDLASRRELLAAVRIAWRIAVVGRARSWGRLFPGADPGAAWGREQVGWLRRFDEPLPPEL